MILANKVSWIERASEVPTARVELTADTKAEVVALNNEAQGINGVPDGTILAVFSTALTLDGSYLSLGSSETWVEM